MENGRKRRESYIKNDFELWRKISLNNGNLPSPILTRNINRKHYNYPMNYGAESRRLSPRTMSLGTDILGNKYWMFSSRKTKEREFGGWLVIQTPDNKLPTGEPTDDTTTTDDPDEYRDLKSWYFVEKSRGY